MASADLTLQKQVFTLIKAQFTADGITATVTAFPREDETLPYVQIGETQSADHVIGEEIRFDVTVYSQKEGPHEAKTIQTSVRTALHNIADFTSGGFNYTAIRVEYTTVNLDPTDRVWQGIQRIRALAS